MTPLRNFSLTLLVAFATLVVPAVGFAPGRKQMAARVLSPKTVLNVGGFDYSAELGGKGKLVVTFEPEPDPDKPEPDPDKPVPVEPLPEVFPGIALPSGEPEPPRIENAFTNDQVDKFVAESKKKVFSPLVIGQPKSDGNSLKVAQDILINVNELGENIDSTDYKFFGNGDHAKSLILLLKSNPFMAPALTEISDGYELKTFDPTGKDPNVSLYRKIMSTLNGVGHRVNFQFDCKMEEVTSFEMYDDVTGSKLEGVDMQTAASSALYGLFFFASCIHGTIHVLHYLYTAAFQVASKDFPEMNKWANDYAKNVPFKYSQVGQVLMPPGDPRNQLAVLTGGSGLGSSEVIRFILKQTIQQWGMKPTAEGFYFDNMMNISRKKIEKDGVILKEFMKHFCEIPRFADSARAALKKIDRSKFAAAEEELGAYLNRCGEFTSKLTTVDQWLEVMAVTGAMHGGTISYTRVLAMPEVLRWRNFVSPLWDFPDAFLLNAGLGTITGMEEGRHVMTDSEGPYEEELQDVLKDYDYKVTKIKQKYQEQLVKDEDFDDFGWILTDFCLDDFDGKQLTIATYI